MNGSGGAIRLAVACIALCAAAAGCGDGGDGGSRVAATNVATGEPPEAVAERAYALVAGIARRKGCKPVERLDRRSIYSFGCPLEKSVRQSMRRFEVLRSATYGTGAVVDYRTGDLSDGASLLMYVGPHGRWAFSRTGLLYDASVGTSDEDSRDGFDRVVRVYVRAVRDRRCDLYFKHVSTESFERKDVCRTEFPRTRGLARALKATPHVEPEYLGGNERFGFYGLTLSQPKPLYRTISVIKMQPGVLQPFLVLDAAPGPAPAAAARGSS